MASQGGPAAQLLHLLCPYVVKLGRSAFRAARRPALRFQHRHGSSRDPAGDVVIGVSIPPRAPFSPRFDGRFLLFRRGAVDRLAISPASLWRRTANAFVALVRGGDSPPGRAGGRAGWLAVYGKPCALNITIRKTMYAKDKASYQLCPRRRLAI